MDFIRAEIDKGRQAYIIFPLIEESAKLDYENLMKGYENVKAYFPEPKYWISMVHGRQPSAQKELGGETRRQEQIDWKRLSLWGVLGLGVLVLGAMFTLVARDVFPLLPVAIIAAREFIISIYRTVASSKGVSVPASKLGKWKTFVQQLAVGFALWPWFAVDAKWVWVSLLWLAVLLSVLSGAHYLWYATRGSRAPAASQVI